MPSKIKYDSAYLLSFLRSYTKQDLALLRLTNALGINSCTQNHKKKKAVPLKYHAKLPPKDSQAHYLKVLNKIGAANFDQCIVKLLDAFKEVKDEAETFLSYLLESGDVPAVIYNKMWRTILQRMDLMHQFNVTGVKLVTQWMSESMTEKQNRGSALMSHLTQDQMVDKSHAFDCIESLLNNTDINYEAVFNFHDAILNSYLNHCSQKQKHCSRFIKEFPKESLQYFQRSKIFASRLSREDLCRSLDANADDSTKLNLTLTFMKHLDLKQLITKILLDCLRYIREKIDYISILLQVVKDFPIITNMFPDLISKIKDISYEMSKNNEVNMRWRFKFMDFIDIA